MLKYACEFTVTGLGPVPMDMIRYDRSTPFSQEDASKAALSMNVSLLPQSVRLLRFTEGKGKYYADNPIVGRWKSFGWTVTDITWRKL